MRAVVVATFLTVIGCSGSNVADVSQQPQAPAPAGETPTPGTPAPSPSAPSAEQRDYFPGDTWDTTSGWDDAKLAELAAYAESKATKSLVLLLGGRILFERHFAGADASSTRDVASVQKSVLSILAGIAIEKGLFSIDDSVSSILGAGWSNSADVQAEAAITVRHLLTMTSGLDVELAYAAPAGTAWLYNNDAFYRVRMVIEKKSGQSIETFARAHLFDPIGMKDSHFQRRVTRDSKDVFVVGLQTSARDLARFGLLLERHGKWNDATIVSSSWIDQATSTSQALNASYGFLFWLNGKSGGLLPLAEPFTGTLVPSAPTDAFAALGHGDQKVWVARSLDVVLTREGDAAGEAKNALSSFDEELWKRVVAAKK
jgi:CubicO group peptidase (beta-lactamase class C family)